MGRKKEHSIAAKTIIRGDPQQFVRFIALACLHTRRGTLTTEHHRFRTYKGNCTMPFKMLTLEWAMLILLQGRASA
jgi:hypothetical protein